jgi:hypothetical protein
VLLAAKSAATSAAANAAVLPPRDCVRRQGGYAGSGEEGHVDVPLIPQPVAFKSWNAGGWGVRRGTGGEGVPSRGLEPGQLKFPDQGVKASCRDSPKI